MITIDGSYGEGGGQILRSSLTLAMITGKSFRIDNIRANRKRPGLLRQHLTAANGAAQISKAIIKGNHIGSQSLYFEPKTVCPGDYHYATGTAGSTMLILQTILLPLLNANGPSHITLEGGTHNPYAPPFDFLQKVFLPILKQMGADVEISLGRPGFYPVGGGKVSVTIHPVTAWKRINLLARGAICKRLAKATVAKLPLSICERELNVVCDKLKWDSMSTVSEAIDNPVGPGNIVTLEIASEHITEMFTAFGEKRTRSRDVPLPAIEEVQEYLIANVPVGAHLADQLMIPMALVGGGSFRTLPLTDHSTTNIETIKKFIDIDITTTKINNKTIEVTIESELEIP